MSHVIHYFLLMTWVVECRVFSESLNPGRVRRNTVHGETRREHKIIWGTIPLEQNELAA